MQDWQRLNRLLFKPVMQNFNLKKLLGECQELIQYQALIYDIKFRVFAYFDSDKDLNRQT